MSNNQISTLSKVKQHLHLKCKAGYFCGCLVSAYFWSFIKRAEIKITEYSNELSLCLTLFIPFIFVSLQ